ncbi:MAG: virginiamycin B lyase family protein [Pseudomonadota bacterium]
MKYALLSSTALFAVASLCSAPVLADDHNKGLAKAEIQEWDVPWEDSRPRDPWVHEGTVWFVGQAGNYVATLDPDSGDFERYEIPDGAHPHTVIVDNRGAWYAGNLDDHIGLVDPESGDVKQYALPGGGPKDSHTMDFTSGGDIWFTVQGGNQLGFLDTDSEQIMLWEVPTEDARPYGLIVENDKPWATLFGTNKLATVEQGQLQEIELEREKNRPRRLGMTDDGIIWYVDYNQGYVGSYNPDSGENNDWRAPAEQNSRPYGMAIDKRNDVWFVETGVQPNRLVGFDTDSKTFSEPMPIPSGGGTVRHMYYDEATDSIWFGTDVDTVGVVRLTP